MFAYTGKILKINLTKLKVVKESLNESLAKLFLGERGLNSAFLYDNVQPRMDPLDPDNPLLFGVGPLNGTFASGCSRFTVSAKSPLTGILGDACAGGFFGPELKFAGYDQIIIEGRASEPVYLWIDDDSVEIRDAGNVWGSDVWETHKIIREELADNRIQVACIGQAGENQVRFAGIFANLARAAGRTGMGTVMGSKRLKAIAVRGSKSVEVADTDGFLEVVETIEDQLFRSPEYKSRSLMGSTRLVNSLNKQGFLVTKHFQTGVFEGANKISGEELLKNYNVKSKACFACPMPCSRFFVIKNGRFAGLHGEGPEYETLGSVGSRCNNDDLNLILKANDMMNRYGMDSITTGEAIAFAMECYEKGILTRKQTDGLDLSWGNNDVILMLIEKIAKKEGFGEVLSHGTRQAAKIIGKGSEKYAMHVKGLEIIAGEPRGMKAFALTYAVGSRGADHLRAEPMFELSNNIELAKKRFGVSDAALRLKFKGKGKVVKYYEEVCAIADSLPMCKNIAACLDAPPNFYELKNIASKLIQTAIGWNTTPGEVQRIGERIINLERAFNVREGITRKDDTLPKRFLKEPLPKECGPSAGSIVELEPMLNEYYQEREWNEETGIPTQRKLKEIGLEYVAKDLKQLGKQNGK